MTKPSGKPAGEKQRSSLLFWLGCASLSLILLLVAVGITMMVMLRRNVMQATGRGVAHGPALAPGWRAQLRADFVLPAGAEALALPRTDSGDAAPVLRAFQSRVPFRTALMRVSAGRPPEPGDAAAFAALLRDSAVARVAAAAKLRGYRVIPAAIADTAAASRYVGVSVPYFFWTLNEMGAVQAVAARGVALEHAGRRDAARADYRAAIALGFQQFFHEATLSGSAQSLGGTRAAALLLRDAAGSDTATRAAAARLAAWAERVRDEVYTIGTGLSQTPDSLLAAATDTTLPFPARAAGVHGGTMNSLLRGPWSIYRGPSRQAFAVVRAVEQDRDPDLARLALTMDSVLTRIDRVGGWTRLHLYMHGQR